MASVLFVCTGNICRSPIAEGFGRAMVAEAGADIEVASAGIVGWEGSPAAHESILAAAECGIDISGHVATRMEPRHAEDADVVVCMAREHRDAVAHLAPRAAGRTFTLKELVRLLEALPATPSTTSFEDRVGMADELRRSGFEGDPADEDVEDPLGATLDAFRAVAWELDDWCHRLSPGLIPAKAKEEAS